MLGERNRTLTMPAHRKLSMLILALAFAFTCVARAQTRPAASGGAIPPKPTANPLQSPAAKQPAAAANFDAHDLTGIWNMSFPQRASQAYLEVYVSRFG